MDFVSPGTHNSFTSQGHNIIGDSSLEYDPTKCGRCAAIDAFNKTGDQTGVTDPKLGSLQDNRGLSQTHALLTGSPAINRGSTTLATDQRGVSRPQGAADDVGAFELEIAVNVAPSFTKGADQTVDEDASAQTVTGWATAISSGPSNESTQTVSFTATNNNNALFSAEPQVSSDGTLTYTPAANANGSATVTVTAKDSGGTADGGVDTSAAQTFTITVTAVDDNPVAVNDTKTVAEDDAATTIDVLSNDTDIDGGGAKSVQSVTQPAHGTVTVTNGGADLTYKPNADYCNGGSPTDDFNYTLNGGSTAKVAVTVTCVNDAPVAVTDSATTNEDTAKDINVIANDTDVDNTNAQLSVSSFTQPANGTVTKNADGTLTYTPKADYSGSDSFTYKAKDAGLDSNSATVNLTVTAVNDAPVAEDDTKTTAEDTPLIFPSSDLVSNDDEGAPDEAGQTLTVTVVFDGTHGTVDLGTDGNITFTPEANYSGDATFTYRVCDNGSPSKCSIETAVVTVTVSPVNDVPVAEGQSVTTNEDTAKEVTLLASDVEGDALSYTIVSGPAHGTLTGSGANQTYTPAANYNGTDSFTFKANDGTDDSNTATVNLTVNAVNDAPVAVTDSATTNEDTATNIDVLANDTDVDGDSLSVSNVGAAGHGTATKNADGTIKYVPDADYSGSDSFDYTVSDGNGGTDTATVSVTVTPVNDPPTVTLTSGGSCSTSTTSVSGTMNLSLADVDSSGVLTPSAISLNPALVPVANIKFGGSGANRTVSVTPVVKKSGSATINITASDGTATSSTTTIQVIVGTDRKETINGTDKSDMIFGQNGDDTINAGAGNDLVCGGNAGGVISGGAGDDTLDGGNGNDVLRGDAGKDIVRGSAGNDTLTGGSEADSFDGGSGTDVATDYNAAEEDTRTNIP